VASSIIDPKLLNKEEKKSWESYEWKRPIDLYGAGGYSIFKSISPNDIK
jgi:hypothetical protein